MSWLRRLIKWALVFELAYLVLVNAALNLPLTQDLLNRIKPDKVYMQWQRAWSWYPFRVHAEGVLVNGQSSSQQWQVSGREATASIALWELLNKNVHIYNGHGLDVEYRQRPRPREDGKYDAYRAFFPDIAGRDNTALAQQPGPDKPGKGWSVELTNMHASGLSKLWIFQVRGEVTGDLYADLSYRSRGGPFELSNGRADVQWQGLYANGNELVSRQGFVKGEVSFAPFVPSQHKGVKVLGFLQVDAELELDVGSLDFLDLYLNRFSGMNVDGAGVISGRLNYAGGRFLPGTELAVAASDLGLQLLRHRVEGEGSVKARVASDSPETLQIETLFETLSARHVDSQVALFSGRGLALSLSGSTTLVGDRSGGGKTVSLLIPSVTVADLSAYQRYIPGQWPLRLHGGNGQLQGRAVLTTETFAAQLALVSKQADVAFKDYRVTTGMELKLIANAPTLAVARLDIGGSYLRLNETTLAAAGDRKSRPLQARVDIGAGSITLKPPRAAGDGDRGGDLGALLASLKRGKGKDLINTADAEFDIAGQVSRLGWINVFIPNRYHLGLSGSGAFKAHATVADGWPVSGTRLTVDSKELGLGILDYQAQGDGSLKLLVSGANGRSDLALDVALKDGWFRRKGEREAFVEDVELRLHAGGKGFSREGMGDELQIRLEIPSAKVRDMGVYNQYFPPTSPLKFSGGSAELKADLQIDQHSTKGSVKLKTEGLRAQLDDQRIAGELIADINISGGKPSDMVFDIAGSTLLFDQVRVSGEQSSFEQQDWSTRLTLTKARVVWRKPVKLIAEADIRIADSRPIVAVFSNHRKKHGWLEKLLTVKDIDGTVRLSIADNLAVIPFAYIASDKIDIGIKGMFGKGGREAIFYARYRKLRGIMKIKDDRRNFDIIRATRTFEDYIPGETPVFKIGVEESMQQLESLQDL